MPERDSGKRRDGKKTAGMVYYIMRQLVLPAL
jgi:hypothetical protein